MILQCGFSHKDSKFQEHSDMLLILPDHMLWIHHLVILEETINLSVRHENTDIPETGDSLECTLKTIVTRSHSKTIIQPQGRLTYYQS